MSTINTWGRQQASGVSIFEQVMKCSITSPSTGFPHRFSSQPAFNALHACCCRPTVSSSCTLRQSAFACSRVTAPMTTHPRRQTLHCWHGWAECARRDGTGGAGVAPSGTAVALLSAAAVFWYCHHPVSLLRGCEQYLCLYSILQPASSRAGMVVWSKHNGRQQLTAYLSKSNAESVSV